MSAARTPLSQLTSRGRRRWILPLAAVVILLVGLVAGIGWVIWWVNDNIDAPGPGATGSGPCGTADAVNLRLVYGDGHTVDACTRDRPACSNGTDSAMPQFNLNNQLRSSSRRYILLIRFDAPLPSETVEQTLTLAPGSGFLPGESASSHLTSAIVQITARDPTDVGYTTVSGSLTVSSTHGVARGQIDGAFIGSGPSRTDRPTPTFLAASPLRITGSFACNH